MNFDYSEEQVQFLDTVDRILAKDFSYFGQRDQHGGFDRALWRSLCEAGLAHVFWGDAAEELEPDLELACGVLARFGYHLYGAPALQGLAPLVGLAHALPSSVRADLAAGSLLATWAGSADEDGLLPYVPYGAEADCLLVRRADARGTRVCLVAASAARVSRQLRAHDGMPLASLELRRADELLPLGSAPAEDTMALLAVHELTGVCERALRETIDYLRVRKQFGQPLAGYQGLQHKVADMHVALETLKAAAFAALVASRGERAAADLGVACRIARKYARRICEDAIQAHGAMGLTDEALVGHCLQRALGIEKLHLQNH